MKQQLQYDSPLGPLSLISRENCLVALRFGACAPIGDSPVLHAAKRWLDSYFSGQALQPELNLAPQGSAFQQLVWQHCRRIPYGQTLTYGQLAQMMACPGAARAVGSALGCNPLLIMIPCHRVLPAAGGVGQYAAGSAIKQALLEREMIDKSALRV